MWCNKDKSIRIRPWLKSIAYDMKYTLLFIFLLISATALAQGTWAPTGAVWHYSYYNQTTSGYVKIESIGDTVIDGKTCKILHKTRIYNDGFSASIDTVDLGEEYTYEESNVVYYYRLGQFFILYDFNASLNDSWVIAGDEQNPDPSCLDSTGTIYVDSTTTVSINSHNLQGLYINSPSSSSWYMYGLAVEKLGCMSYMFPEVNQCLADYYEGGFIRCYSDSIFGFYQRDTTACDYIYMADAAIPENKNFDISIYPNPVKDIVSIEITQAWQTGNYHINIYSLLGERLKKIRPEGKTTTIDISDLPDGCYFIEVTNSKKEKTSKKLIKNTP